MTLSIDTKIVICAAGVIFLVSLLLGAWKYHQMATSPQHLAHPYVDTAHRAALLYSFATMLIATFVQFSAWSVVTNLTAAAIVIAFFVIAISSYVYHGWRRDTDNQLRKPVRGTTFCANAGTVNTAIAITMINGNIVNRSIILVRVDPLVGSSIPFELDLIPCSSHS
jgi:amino acid transporter